MADDKYDKARDLAEKALEEFVDGNENKAAKLTEQAKKTDPQAVEDVVRDLDEDADSEHDPAKINAQIKEDLGSDAEKQ